MFGSDFPKLFLGFESVVFDVIFMLQHFVIYRKNNKKFSKHNPFDDDKKKAAQQEPIETQLPLQGRPSGDGFIRLEEEISEAPDSNLYQNSIPPPNTNNNNIDMGSRNNSSNRAANEEEEDSDNSIIRSDEQYKLTTNYRFQPTI